MISRLQLRSVCVRLLVTFLCTALFLIVWSRLFRPQMETRAQVHDPDEVAATEASRVYPTEIGKGPVIWQEVDYSDGSSGSWYPRGEAPILAELVAEGKLPRVEERVGPEPVVLKGIDGLGNYGGTWIMAPKVEGMSGRIGGAHLFRWSPMAYPVVPHIAKSYEALSDHREYIIHLRKGIRWSDGHPYTADDILYWWEHEATDPVIWSKPPKIMMFRAKRGEISKIDDYTVKFSFDSPHPLFIEQLATGATAKHLTETPAHYLRQYHPVIGNQELIKRTMRTLRQPSKRSLYTYVKNWDNPQHPRMWPWVFRTYKANGPWNYVRNPYYYAVDPKGRQLPYVDRMLIQDRSAKTIGLGASNGEFTLQFVSMEFDLYELFMAGRERGDYEVYNWSWSQGSSLCLHINLNGRIDPDEPATGKRRRLLNEKKFRQALSLAINRKAIIETEFAGVVEPAQAAPGPDSPYYEPSLYHAYTEYAPDRANALLDELGLTPRDDEGYRTFRDGSRMTFSLLAYVDHNPEKLQAVVEDWANIGVRAIFQVVAARLRQARLQSRDYDIILIGAFNLILPLLDPSPIVPFEADAGYGIGFAKWYMRGGFYGDELAKVKGSIPIPKDHPLYRAVEAYDQALITPDQGERIEIFREALKIAGENLWTISVCSAVPNPVTVKNGFRNVPRKLLWANEYCAPANSGTETYYFEEPYDSPGAIAQIKAEVERAGPTGGISDERLEGGPAVTQIVRRLILGILGVGLVLVGTRHPYIGRRLLIMAPTMIIVSVISFTIIQLPPGDFISSYIVQLEESGEEADQQRIREIISMFHLEHPLATQYLRWIGLKWFITFDPKDQGLLQGNMGQSMATLGSVNDLIGDRLLLTFLISLGTIIFTWSVALPIGIYAAVRQYSLGDYLATIVGFIGMCIPNFLLALLLMYASSRYFGIHVSGLFSAEFAAQPEWSWAKTKDLFQHIWLPILVIGVGGTASMVRVMRGNLLDELRKPYVTTALAKGVRPFKLLIKYPVRIALNPFISGIGSIFPQLVSGGAIVAIVLSFPTVGPLMLSALLEEDMYLAGSMLMLLTLLGIFGVLVSDLLLLAIDPRIRMEGGKR